MSLFFIVVFVVNATLIVIPHKFHFFLLLCLSLLHFSATATVPVAVPVAA